MKSIENIEREAIQQIHSIMKETRNVYIMNAGRMNHGKSSLFNSLLDNKLFETGDYHVTTESNDAEFLSDNSVYLVDTPGLDVEQLDDKEAFNAYKRANMIVFVHTLKIGELHRDEIEHINKIAEVFPSKKYFWEHFCLVLTFIDEVKNPDERQQIKEKIKNDIEKYCGEDNFPIFEVSNSRYQKGKKENNKKFIELSGIPKLKNFLKGNVSTWKSELNKLEQDRINVIKERTRNNLLQQRRNIENNLNIKEKEMKNKQRIITNIVENFQSNIEEIKSNLEGKIDQLQRLEKQVENLKDRHRKDKARY